MPIDNALLDMEVALLSMGVLLAKLEEHPSIMGDQELSAIVYNANKFHELAIESSQGIKAQFVKLAHELEVHIRGPNEIVGKGRFSHIEKYRQIYENGGDVDLICRIAISDGVEEFMLWRVLSSLTRSKMTMHEVRDIITRNATY